MIGFTQYSPAVLALLVNRDKFFPLVVHNTSEITCAKIAEFLSNPDKRIKILMIASMDILAELIERFDLFDVKVVVLDTIPNLSRAELEIQDAQRRPDGSYQFFTITPSDLNKALIDCEFGVPESGIKQAPALSETVELKAKILRKNLSSDNSQSVGELSSLIKKLTSQSKLGKREEFIVVEDTLKFILGIISKRKYNSICSTYNLDKKLVKNILTWCESSKGNALRIAFIDANLYNTDSLAAVKEARASKEDFDFITSVLPLDNEYEYVIEIPSKLVKKRKDKISNVLEKTSSKKLVGEAV